MENKFQKYISDLLEQNMSFVAKWKQKSQNVVE